jgi:hypothetical protein
MTLSVWAVARVALANNTNAVVQRNLLCWKVFVGVQSFFIEFS